MRYEVQDQKQSLSRGRQSHAIHDQPTDYKLQDRSQRKDEVRGTGPKTITISNHDQVQPCEQIYMVGGGVQEI